MADANAGTAGEEQVSSGGGAPDTTTSGGGGAPASGGSGGQQGATNSILGDAPAPQDGASGGSGGETAQTQDTKQSPILEMIGDEELKQDQSLQQIQSVEDLAKGYVHAQKLIGKDKMPIPKDENDTAAWDDVMSKLGRPDNPDDYELPGLAEDSPVELPEGMDKWFKNKAHELGLTNKQAREMWSSYLSDVAEQEVQSVQQKAEQAKQEAEQQLKKDFGNAFDEKIQDAKTALKQYDTDGSVQQALDQSGLGNDPNVVKMLSKIGEQFREDKVGGSSKSFARTPEQAQAEIRDLKLDQGFMQQWMDNNHPGHDAAVQKMQELYKEAYPG